MKKYNKISYLILIFIFNIIIIYPSVSQAQNWIDLPPYNTLWPLWSPALSPVDSVTGLPTPLVSSLAVDTELPLMPGLTWDPSMPYPWLLYNTLAGMAYFDPLAGINLWPAPSLLDDAGIASPIPLPAGYADLPPTDASWLATNVNIANNSYLLAYQSFTPTLAGPPWLATPPALTSLLTPLDILGPILGVPSALAPIAPPVPAPALPLPLPTVPAPTVLAPTAAISQVVANQAGTWIGTWYLGFLYGDMSMVLVEDPITGYLEGTVILTGNLALPAPVDVFGTATAGSIDVSGIDASGTLAMNIDGILISPTEMTGTWTVLSVSTGAVVKNGAGTFEATLVNAFTVAAPPPLTAVVPAPTAVAPPPTTVIVPPPTIIAPPVVTPTIAAPPVVPLTVPAPTLPIPTTPVTALPSPIVPVPTAPVPTVIVPTAAISQIVPLVPLFIAEQAGTWSGTWTTGLVSGPMNMNLVTDLFGGVSGYCQLLGNPILGTLVDNLLGTVLNNQIYVSGSGLGAGSTTIKIDIIGTMTSATTMTGTYTLIDSSSIKEVGSFALDLLPPII
ncbi:MAG: hypothetical protein ACMUJM_12380 [bacterium]